ncbi:hypothetical protein [Varibaculum prostatecancerukia]|uniref:hypothetical protein n=1 Tax=Varibaculum prostatecancerukia TaxID=2811781 RepID=UPI001BFFF101|nr:hypothetical protein [Varibaculum prostatecancerukia]
MIQSVSKRALALFALLALALSVIIPCNPGNDSPGFYPVAEILEQMPVGEVEFLANPGNHRQGTMPETQFALSVFGNGSYSRKRGKREP